MKKLILVLMVSVMVLAVAFSLFACTPSNEDGSGDQNQTENNNQGNGDVTPTPVLPEADDACSFVSIDINPEISLTVDENDVVVTVYGENEDGKVLLYEETAKIVGKDVETAVDTIVDLAIEYGYLTEENKVVGTTVSSADDEKIQALLNKVNGKITASAKKSGLTVEIDPEGAFSMLRDLEELKAKYPDNTAVQSLTVSKFQLALSASESGDISLIGAVELDDEELIEMIAESHSKMEAFVTESYLKAKSEAMAIYDKVAGLAIDGVYSKYYFDNAMAHVTTCYYGPVYLMYSATARGFDAIADAMEYADEYVDYELTPEQVTTVMSGLQIQDRTLIEDVDGKVTIDSIEAYADKELKNMDKGAEYDAYKAQIASVLGDMEAGMKATAQEMLNTYVPTIKALMSEMEIYVNALETLKTYPMVSGKVEEYVNDYRTLVGEVSSAIDGNVLGLTADEFRAKVDELKEKAEGVLELIEEDLSDAEEEAVEALIEAKLAEIKAQREALEETLKGLEESAKSRLATLKEERKTANA